MMSSLKSAQRRGLITKAPDSPSTLSRYLEDMALTPVLKHLIQQSTLPLWGLDNGVFATDATAFSTRVRGTWLKSKQRASDKEREKQEGVGEIEETGETEEFEEVNRRQWIKAHCVFGTTTKIVTAVEASIGTEADTDYLQDLTSTTLSEHEVIDMCVDMGYLSNNHYEFMDSLGINLWMPFKSNSKESSPNRRPDGPWERAFHFFHLNRDEFLKRYHPRSISETGFSMIKANYSDLLRGRNLIAQYNELLCKVLAHNVCCLITAMYEFDLDLSFGKKDSGLELPEKYYTGSSQSNGLSIYGTPKPKLEPQSEPELEPPGGPILVT